MNKLQVLQFRGNLCVFHASFPWPFFVRLEFMPPSNSAQSITSLRPYYGLFLESSMIPWSPTDWWTDSQGTKLWSDFSNFPTPRTFLTSVQIWREQFSGGGGGGLGLLGFMYLVNWPQKALGCTTCDTWRQKIFWGRTSEINRTLQISHISFGLPTSQTFFYKCTDWYTIVPSVLNGSKNSA